MSTKLDKEKISESRITKLEIIKLKGISNLTMKFGAHLTCLIGENGVGGYTDLIQVSEIARKGENSSAASYYRQTVGVNGIHNYVNAGVLVFNIQQMIENNVEQKCIEAA